jgi:hypothetical protein
VAVESVCPALVAARDLLDRFQAMVASGKPDYFDPWLAAAREAGWPPSRGGIAADGAAVLAAVTEPWSNGQTEGQVRSSSSSSGQMYGRGKVDCYGRASSESPEWAGDLHQDCVRAPDWTPIDSRCRGRRVTPHGARPNRRVRAGVEGRRAAWRENDEAPAREAAGTVTGGSATTPSPRRGRGSTIPSLTLAPARSSSA